ncbi:MAG TPA: MBL fold metallo-hydrolase [Candidatus Woesearchaeota archaeon]|nr:MBL fold metallo-hydrolase [Candidatus Woesearchaeota archaeon]
MIELFTLGGYGTVGRNMTLVKYKDEAVVLDIGLHLENLIRFSGENDDIRKTESPEELMKAGALPDLIRHKTLLDKVLAIIPSHAHLDHVGGVPYLYRFFRKAEIIGSPFTLAVLNELERGGRRKAASIQKIRLSVNGKHRVSRNIKVQFVSASHSVPDAVFVVVQTPDGNVVYANDFKIDFSPGLGSLPNLRKLSKFRKPKALVMDSLYAGKMGKTPSESVAKEMLSDVFLQVKNQKGAIFITTFSSHIARLKEIVEISRKCGRTPVFIGRSLFKYMTAAESIDLVDLSSKHRIVRFNDKIVSLLRKVEQNPEKYVVVCTGHQGEPNSVLSRIVYNRLYGFSSKDSVIFSSIVIPGEENIRNRERLELAIDKTRARVFRDIHVSGHASREDHRELLDTLLPEKVFPAHCELSSSKILKDFVEASYDSKVIIASEHERHAF